MVAPGIIVAVVMVGAGVAVAVAALVASRSSNQRAQSYERSNPPARPRPQSAPPARSDAGNSSVRQRLPENRQTISTNTECCICQERRPKVGIYPCGHAEACETCVINVIQDGNRLCPFCRAYIQGFA